jgi:hypothetical protein
LETVKPSRVKLDPLWPFFVFVTHYQFLRGKNLFPVVHKSNAPAMHKALLGIGSRLLYRVLNTIKQHPPIKDFEAEVEPKGYELWCLLREET